MSYLEGHRQRLRDLFNESGLGEFENQEFREMLLTSAIARKDVKPIGRGPLDHWRWKQELTTCEDLAPFAVDELATANNELVILLTHENHFLRTLPLHVPALRIEPSNSLGHQQLGGR